MILEIDEFHHIAVDTYMVRRVAFRLRARAGRSVNSFAYHHEELDRGGARAYQAKRIVADPQAIANFDALPRPKRPPGR